MAKPIGGIFLCDLAKRVTDGNKQTLIVPGLYFAQEGFDLAPHHLDRIVIR